MKRNTIKWRMFQYNLVIIIMLVALVTVIFNLTVRLYFEKDTLNQLNRIASRIEDTALRKGPDFFPGTDRDPSGKRTPMLPPPPREEDGNEVYRYYFMLDRSLREPLSILNADYILLDSSKNVIKPSSEEYFNPPSELVNRIVSEIGKAKDPGTQTYMNFSLSGTKYIAIVKPVSEKNTFGLGWLVIYSSLQKLNQLQLGINIILLSIFVLSALIMVLLSSIVAKKITTPFSTLSRHVSAIAERNFGTKIETPVYEELQELVNNFNLMSEKLETYDKAQKTFLQNASHEFRTPLMSIQSYAEGIKYEVMDSNTAADIIVDESKRLTHLVEDLLYLSRLDSIEENYRFDDYFLNDVIRNCIERMNGIAQKSGITIASDIPEETVKIHADEEKLSRAIKNIISNCIRYAKNTVTVALRDNGSGKAEILIYDDGSGFDPDELPNIFERFYKGKKGVFGLGLAISKNVIERHSGTVTAENTDSGALFRIELPVTAPAA